ncbi:hypothetical protein [Umezawaea beigongshangensis]|uniref:hypothetical protein n=1 Tax=Umezawaea beigongshangensis TaxID=2780383 RepID=UPI0018F22910|nr:hypothetical protein [Umezawaea beigongshangensis]
MAQNSVIRPESTDVRPAGPSRLADETSRGRTTVASSAVREVAGTAAREISGAGTAVTSGVAAEHGEER